ncbi:hypothetical protein ALP99_102651 [Pseudomonas syringae pv. tomato]|uniref:Uncharacterized protein n=3 Tax=Pseudomonas syringae group TaxID=136849 RepID=A0A0Q0F3R8_PSESX|nr:hypothetical protein ALO94_200704 [Pseudomonas syringae pv. spinaceae]RMO85220.1 hypothetical protein ALQ34_103646 [Pseudomonas syringae pv. maculicola]RMQ81085.1 hypothetical protein ALP99_102651 [Pseudomonas syringae pv. tomato]RMR24078.1 hypothetical protein ALP89_102624 [Pseudomonas syringae pv. persicae]RMU45543.1 hypothetical protein ALP29_201139 [Pseudomonas syringae pv. avii]
MWLRTSTPIESRLAGCRTERADETCELILNSLFGCAFFLFESGTSVVEDPSSANVQSKTAFKHSLKLQIATIGAIYRYVYRGLSFTSRDWLHESLPGA